MLFRVRFKRQVQEGSRQPPESSSNILIRQDQVWYHLGGFNFITFVCVIHTHTHRSENLYQSVLSFHHAGPEDGTQVSGLVASAFTC